MRWRDGEREEGRQGKRERDETRQGKGTKVGGNIDKNKDDGGPTQGLKFK